MTKADEMRLREAANGLIDAIANPKGRDFRAAWDRACLMFGRFGAEPVLLSERKTNA